VIVRQPCAIHLAATSLTLSEQIGTQIRIEPARRARDTVFAGRPALPIPRFFDKSCRAPKK
jgi:hypothetical protein